MRRRIREKGERGRGDDLYILLIRVVALSVPAWCHHLCIFGPLDRQYTSCGFCVFDQITVHEMKDYTMIR